MFLHFSDWSEFIKSLEEKGIPHGGRIIKVYASHEYPGNTLGRLTIPKVEVSGEPFTNNEVFAYPERESYTGTELEEEMTRKGLSEAAKFYVRALFRFANSEELQACQFAMSLKDEGGNWMFDHPFEDLDGITESLSNPRRNGAIHLDIFGPRSLVNLQKFVDFNDETQLIDKRRELLRLIMPERNITPEGQVSNPEKSY